MIFCWAATVALFGIMKISNPTFVIAQIQQAQPANPLINQGGEDTIYIGVGLLAILVVLIVGIFSRRIGYAIGLSALLSLILILVVVMT